MGALEGPLKEPTPCSGGSLYSVSIFSKIFDFYPDANRSIGLVVKEVEVSESPKTFISKPYKEWDPPADMNISTISGHVKQRDLWARELAKLQRRKRGYGGKKRKRYF